MPAFLPKLEADILARAQADTASGGLYHASAPIIKGMYNTIAPIGDDAVGFPLVVYNLYGVTNENALGTRHFAVDIYFNIWVERDGTTAAITRADAILNRILGDWDEQTTGVPSYGFDRWQPALSGTSWLSTIMEVQEITTAHERELFHWVLNFRTYCSKVKAS